MSQFEKQLPFCVYHKNCLDGIAAAWVVWRHFKGEVELLAADYGDPIPAKSHVAGRDVYLVDFSWPRDVVIEYMQICNLTILDHHETAAKALEGLVEVDQTRSGAMLTWNHFNPGEDPPSGIKFCQDRDLWQWKHPGSKPWTVAAFSYPLEVEVFNRVVRTPIGDIIREGETLLRKHNSDVEKIARQARPMMIDGVTVPVVNANSLFVSDLAGALAEGHQYAVCYVDSRDARHFSLRSRNNGADVNLIAERFGGGGHKRAAGFRIMFDDPRFTRSHLELNSHDV